MSGRGSKPGEAQVEALTRREREILALLAQGYSGPEIAEQLTLALSSVKFHIQNIYGKLGVNSKRQALTRAGELGLVAPVRGLSPAAHQTESLGGGASFIGFRSGRPDLHRQVDSQTPAPNHNLPLQVTRFFGREAEIARLTAYLGEHRLVTLTGWQEGPGRPAMAAAFEAGKTMSVDRAVTLALG